MSSPPPITRTLLWTQVVLAAVAMVLTIPSRTQGLGIITKYVVEDPSLGIDHLRFATLNGAATLLGAAFALPFGWLIDRAGVRVVLGLNLLLLGLCTATFTLAAGTTSFFLGMLLMRGIGQSALSATSLTVVGKWFPTRLTTAMTVFTVVATIGFMAVFGIAGELVKSLGWRQAWAWLGWACIVFGIVCWILCRNPVVTPSATESIETHVEGVTLGAALRSWPFWVLALSSGLFNWVSSGIGLFNLDVFHDQGLSEDLFHQGLMISALFTLLANGLAGWLMRRWALPRIMAIGMVLLAACLAILPHMSQEWHVYVNAAVLGSSAGVVMVVFFACWASYFGRRHLGKIQGVAQAITVLASALGPISLAWAKDAWGSYPPLFWILAALALVSAGALVVTRAPSKSS